MGDGSSVLFAQVERRARENRSGRDHEPGIERYDRRIS
jgi:hypothetical protein